MVRLAAPVAINRDDSALDTQTGETAEDLERRIQAEYDEALGQQRQGNKVEAQALFQQLLAEPALQNVAGEAVVTLTHARYLVLKNLAGSLACDDATCEEALQLYIEASELDASDTVLWQRLGSLASELGQWSLARHALESGLRCSPQHYIIQKRLLEVLLELADWQSISALLQLMLQQNSGNLRAIKVFLSLQSQQEPSRRNNLCISDTATQQEDDLTALQPQLKRRCISSPHNGGQHPHTEHCIVLQHLTWQSLTKALYTHLTEAASRGLPAASTLKLAPPEPEGITGDVDMISSPPAADTLSSQQAALSSELNLGESDDAGRQESVTEGKAKEADVVPVVVPQRASRRLGSSRAATEAGSDHESPEPTKDVVTLLAPFLPPQPQTSGSQPAPREFSVDAIVPSSPDVLSPEAERAEVQAFVDQQQVNSGLYAVASALLGKLLSSPATPISPKLREDLMRLENAVQGWKRPAVVALTLAELYYQALVTEAASQRPAKKQVAATQASSRQLDQLMSSCIANIGMFEAALMQQQSAAAAAPQAPSASNTSHALVLALGDQDDTAMLLPHSPVSCQPGTNVHQLLVRYHWLNACLSEHLKQFEDASQQFESCKAALAALSDPPDSAQQFLVTANGLVISTSSVDSRLEMLKIVSIVEEGRKWLDEGRHEELLSRLGPVLLTGNTSQLPLNVPQQLAGLDLIKEAATGPEAWQTQLQCLLVTASIQLPFYPNTTTSHHTPHARHAMPAARLSTITALATELEKHIPAWEKKVHVQGYSQAAGLGELLARLLWQLLGLVQELYASLAGSPSSSPPRRSLDVKDQQKQKGLLQAFQLLLSLRKLDPRLPLDSQSHLQLLGTGAGLLVDTGILGLANGAYLKTCLQTLAPAFIECTHAGTNTDDAGSALVSAAAQCLYLLYGLDLPDRDEQWTAGFQGKANCPDPQNREEAVLLWTYLAHFCQSLTNRSKLFKSRLQELLTAIHTQVPSPPDAVLANFDLDVLLDSAATACMASAAAAPLDEDMAMHQQGQSDQHTDCAAADAARLSAEQAASVVLHWDSEALTAAIGQDPDASLHAELYHMLAECAVDVFERLDDSLMVQQQGHNLVLKSLELTRCELAYHPRRYESWERVLNVYVTAGNTLANAAVEKALTSEQWRQSDLHQRHSLYCNRALSAIHYASLAAADIEDDKERADTLAFLEEQKGNLFLEQVQNAPPLYNQMQHSPKSDDPQYRQKCLAGLNGFQKAQLTLDEEWEFQLSIAKLLRKLGTDSRQVLHHLAKACHLAKEFAGGSVESIYQLHATRLKLLQEDQLDLAALQQHCFLPETRLQLERITAAAGSVLPEHASSSSDTFAAAASTAAAASKLGNSATQSHQQQAELLYQDATSAMEYCLEQSKQNRGGQYETFHKARYRRAQALYQRGQQQQALAELQPLFKGKSKNGFAVNMYVIPEGVNKGKKAYAASDAVDTDMEIIMPKPAVPEQQWGEKVDSLSVNGVEETPRKFCAHVRRALILYICLLRDTGDLDALRGVVTALRGRDFGSYTDIGRWAFGVYIHQLAAALQHMHLTDMAAGPASSHLQLPERPRQPDSQLPAHPGSDAGLPQTMSQAVPSHDPMQASAAGLVIPEPAADSPADVELLEKAFHLYQEACLLSDAHLSWEHAVTPALQAAANFHPSSTASTLGNAQLSPESLYTYALAYIHSLGASSNLDKLREIQRSTRRERRRTTASAEDRQSVHIAAAAAEQAVLDTDLNLLELQVHEALQTGIPAGSNGAAVAQGAEAPAQVSAPETAALDVFFGVQPAAVREAGAAAACVPTILKQDRQDVQISEQAEAIQTSDMHGLAHASQQPEPMQRTNVPGQMHESGQPEQSSELEPAPTEDLAEPMQMADPAATLASDSEAPHQELLVALFKLLKRLHEMSKSMGVKAEMVSGPPTRTESLLSRAYSAYWRLSWPAKPAVTVQGAAVMSAVDDLVQQAKSGTDVPKPKLSPAFL